MVKVEPNPDTIEIMDISKHHSKIDNILFKTGYMLITWDLNSEYFHADIKTSEQVMIKSKWPFIKPTEHTVYKTIARAVFELSTVTIYLTATLTHQTVNTESIIYPAWDGKYYTVRSDIKELAERLEKEGYNVTIWV